jgi:hypothetical protein
MGLDQIEGFGIDANGENRNCRLIDLDAPPDVNVPSGVVVIWEGPPGVTDDELSDAFANMYLLG